MPLILKSYLRSLVVDSPLSRLVRPARSQYELEAWERSGKLDPPPHAVKQRVVAAYSSEFQADVLVETGTFRGDMVEAMKDRFAAIYSIELSADLWNLARRRFRAYPHIHILHGDSGTLLPLVLSNVAKRCLFWLDGHYSGGETARGQTETPVVREVEAVLDSYTADHVVLIDDARCFDGSHDYPSLGQLRELVAAKRPDYEFCVLNDVIRIHPRRDSRGHPAAPAA